MAKEVGIILASHGDFAQEALGSLEMIIGKQESIETVSLYSGEDLSDVIQKVESCLRSLTNTDGIVIICDIFGGTPSNAAAALLLKYSNKKIAAFAGLNLPVLLEIALNRTNGFESAVEIANNASKKSWVELKKGKKLIENEVDL